MAALRNKRLIVAHSIATLYIHIYTYIYVYIYKRLATQSLVNLPTASSNESCASRKRRNDGGTNDGFEFWVISCKTLMATRYTLYRYILTIRYYNLRRFVCRAMRYASILGLCRDANDARHAVGRLPRSWVTSEREELLSTRPMVMPSI